MLKKEKHGYYTIKNLPTPQELNSYYANQYYQNQSGQYQEDYSKEEIQYFENEALEYEFICRNKLRVKGRAFLDLGCGEGWNLKMFHRSGWKIQGVDFSSFGLQQFNPEMVKFFKQSDIEKYLNETLPGSFDVVLMKNVLEHVLDEHLILSSCKKVVQKNGVMIVKVPNDFSKLHEYLLDNKFIDRQFWVAPPAHLRYFTHQSLVNLMEHHGFKPAWMSSDYPIDMDLLVEEMNYIQKKEKGKISHHARVAKENFMYHQNMEGICEMHAALAKMGIGRNVIGVFKLK